MAREVDRSDMGRSIAWLSDDYSRYARPSLTNRDVSPPPRLPARQMPRQYRGQTRTVRR